MLLARVIGRFEVGADFCKREPGVLEFAASVQLGLICVMAAFGVAAGAEGVNRQGANLRRKVHDAYIRCAGNSVEAFLSRRWAGIKGEYGAVVAADSRNRKTRAHIVELFALTFINSLEAIELTPRNAPRAKPLLECIEGFVERIETCFSRRRS